jgi:regulator of protease activity HflC (stomatin/prohibitin superfamily)
MSTQVILNLPDKVYNQAARLAELMNQDVPRVLAETIESVLSPLGVSVSDFEPVGELSDSEVLAAVDLRMDEAQGRRLGRLLDRQQAGKLKEAERNELAALMQVYHECLVRKSQALGEAVRRGLREPLAP